MCDCSKALIQDTTRTDLSNIQKLAILSMMSEAVFNEKKNSGGGSFGFNIDEIGINASGNYADFQKQVRQVASSYGCDSFTQHAAAYATSSLSENSLKAYHDCLMNSRGLQIIAVHRNKDSYTLQIWGNPPPDTERHKAKLLFVDNIESHDLKDLESIVAKADFSRAIDLEFSIRPANAKKEIGFAVYASPGRSAQILLPPLDPWDSSESITQRSWNGIAFNAEIDANYKNEINIGEIVRGSTYTVQRNTLSGAWTVTGNHTGGSSPATVTRSDTTRNQRGFFSLWGRTLQFTDDGKLYDYQESGGIAVDKWLMGRVYIK